MATITTRSGKGSALTHTELDDNFSNLNSDKAELSGADFTGDISVDGDVTLTGVESTGAGAELTFTDDGSPGLSADIKFTGSSGNGGGYAASLEGEGDLQYSAGGHLFADNSLVSGGVPVAYYKLNTDHRFATNYIQRMLINNAGNVYLYEDTGASAKMIWNASAETLEFADNVKANFGSAGDLQIYHNGSHSYVSDSGTGDLKLYGANIEIGNTAGFKNIFAASGGGTFVYYNNALKLATTTTGVDVTGTVTADGLTVDGAGARYFSVGSTDGSGATLRLDGSSNGDFTGGDYSTISNSGTKLQIIAGTPSAPIELQTHDGTGNKLRQNIASNGDISFYEDTGTTAKFFWDASAESLGIGASPDTELHVASATGPVLRLESTNTVLVANEAVGAIEFESNDASTGSSGIAGKIDVISDGTTPDYSMRFFTLDNQAGTPNFSERMRITKEGNVGIGTSSPADALHISSNDPRIRLTDTDTGADSSISAGSGAGSLFIDADFNNESAGSVIAFGVDGSEAMRIDSSGNVGIGGSTPSEKLEVSNGSAIDAGEISIKLGGDVDNSARTMTITKDTSSPYNAIINTQNNTAVTTGSLVFKNGSTEQMRLDSSGNAFIGKTGIDLTAAGIELRNSGLIAGTVDGSYVARLNRNTSDGAIVEFRKDNSTVGSIGASTGYLYIGNGDTNLAFSASSNLIFPRGTDGASRDAAIDFGNSSNRFKDLYLSGGAYLGGTAAANLLDDYEEGTFTVAVEGSTTAGTGTYATRNGRYTKIGNVVHVRMYINMSAHTGAGNLLITGLPFNAKNAANEFFTASIDFSNNISKTADNYIYGLLRPNTSQIEVQRQPTSGASTVWNLYVPLDTSFQASLSLTYVTD